MASLPPDTPTELPVLDGTVGAICVLTSPAAVVTTEATDKDVRGSEMEVSSRASDVVPLTWAMVGLSPKPVRVVEGLAAEATALEGNGLAVEDDVDTKCCVECSWLKTVVLSNVTVSRPTLIVPAVDQGTGDGRPVDGWDVADKLGSALPLLLLDPLLNGAADVPAREGESLPPAMLDIGEVDLALPVTATMLVALLSRLMDV